MAKAAMPCGPSLEARIANRLTNDGSVIIPPRMARWLEKQAGMTADRRARLYFTDIEAYEVLLALHLVARSDCGTERVVGQHNTQQSELWMSTSQAAKTLGVTDRCVRKWCATGRLRATLSGSRWLIDRNSLALRDIA
jgi:excisionase family DNA binding protein